MKKSWGSCYHMFIFSIKYKAEGHFQSIWSCEQIWRASRMNERITINKETGTFLGRAEGPVRGEQEFPSALFQDFLQQWRQKLDGWVHPGWEGFHNMIWYVKYWWTSQIHREKRRPALGKRRHAGRDHPGPSLTESGEGKRVCDKTPETDNLRGGRIHFGSWCHRCQSTLA